MRSCLTKQKVLYGALLRLAVKRNITVIEVKFSYFVRGGDITGLYSRCSGKDLIFIEQGVQAKKKALILAHELGHYSLHRDILNTTCWAKAYHSDRKYRNKKEAEADRFARKLLAFLARMHFYDNTVGGKGD